MSLDFTRLNNEYNDFWSKHDLPGAINQITKVENWINAGGVDPFSFSKVEDQIKPPFLVSLYSDQNGIDMTLITNNTSYIDLIQWYKTYLNTFVNQIEDFKTRTLAMNDKNIFDSIIDSIVSIGSSLLWIGAGVIAFYILIKQL